MPPARTGTMPHSPGYDRVDVHIDPVAGQASARSRRSWFVPPLVLGSPQLVEHDGAAGSYWLPADHAAGSPGLRA
jgi:hypothetical protein